MVANGLLHFYNGPGETVERGLSMPPMVVPKTAKSHPSSRTLAESRAINVNAPIASCPPDRKFKRAGRAKVRGYAGQA